MPHEYREVKVHMTDAQHAQIAQQAKDKGFGTKIAEYLLSLFDLKPYDGGPERKALWDKLLAAAEQKPLGHPFRVADLFGAEWEAVPKEHRTQLGRKFKELVDTDPRFLVCGRTSGNHMLYRRVR